MSLLVCFRVFFFGDSYLHQHIREPTRGRGSDKSSVLDLVLTNEEGIIEKLCVTAPLGKSVHSIITMDLNCSHDVPKNNKVYNKYDKGDYNKFYRMMDLDWDELYINAKGDVNSQWMIFKELYQKALEESVPRSSGNRRGKSHAIH